MEKYKPSNELKATNYDSSLIDVAKRDNYDEKTIQSILGMKNTKDMKQSQINHFYRQQFFLNNQFKQWSFQYEAAQLKTLKEVLIIFRKRLRNEEILDLFEKHVIADLRHAVEKADNSCRKALNQFLESGHKLFLIKREYERHTKNLIELEALTESNKAYQKEINKTKILLTEAKKLYDEKISPTEQKLHSFYYNKSYESKKKEVIAFDKLKKAHIDLVDNFEPNFYSNQITRLQTDIDNLTEHQKMKGTSFEKEWILDREQAGGLINFAKSMFDREEIRLDKEFEEKIGNFVPELVNEEKILSENDIIARFKTPIIDYYHHVVKEKRFKLETLLEKDFFPLQNPQNPLKLTTMINRLEKLILENSSGEIAHIQSNAIPDSSDKLERDEEGNTSMHYLLHKYKRTSFTDRERLLPEVKLLLESNCFPYQKNKIGLTAYDYANDLTPLEVAQREKKQRKQKEDELPDWALVQLFLKYMPIYSEFEKKVKDIFVAYIEKAQKQLHDRNFFERLFERLFFNRTIKAIIRLNEIAFMNEAAFSASRHLADKELLAEIQYFITHATRGWRGVQHFMMHWKSWLSAVRKGKSLACQWIMRLSRKRKIKFCHWSLLKHANRLLRLKRGSLNWGRN